MNKVFKVIWNHATQTWTAVSELGHAKGKTKSKKIVKLTALAGAVIGVMGTAQAAVDTSLSTITIKSDAPGNVAGTNQGESNINIGTGANTYRLENGKVSNNAIAIGTNATGTGDKSVAIGKDSSAKVENGIAIGFTATNESIDSVAIGTRAKSSKDMDVAIGKEAQATGGESLAFGSQSKASGQATVAVGKESNASGSSAVAAGYQSAAAGDNAVAVGKNTTAGATNAIAVGLRATATGTRAIATGAGSKASGEQSLAAGFMANAIANNTIAQGNTATAHKESDIAIGTSSVANGSQQSQGSCESNKQNDPSAPTGSATSGDCPKGPAIAIGKMSNATGYATVAVGLEAKATNDYATALGSGSTASIANSVALGSGSVTDAFVPTNTATVGKYTYSGFAGNSSSLGDGAVVSVGYTGPDGEFVRQIQNVAAGRIDVNSTDAVNGSQLYVVAENLSNRIDSHHWVVGTNHNKQVSDVYNNDQVNFIDGNATTAKVVQNQGTPNVTNVSYDVNVGQGLKIDGTKVVANLVAGNGVTLTNNVTTGEIKISANSTGGAASSVVSGNNNTLNVTTDASNPSEYIVTPVTGSLSVTKDGNISSDDANVTTNNGEKLTTIKTTRDMINGSHWNLQIGESTAPGDKGSAEIETANKEAEAINPGDQVTFLAGKNITLKRNGSQIAISAKDASVDKGEIIPATDTTNTNNNGTVMVKGNDGDKFANITNVVNAINSAFWKIGEENSGKPEVKGNVTAGSQVNFSNGVGTIAKVTADEANKTYKVQYDVNAGPGIEISTDENDPNKGKVTVKVDNSTVTINDAGQLVANSAWNANATGNVDGTSAAKTVKANATVNFDAGENLKVKQTGDEANQVYSFSLNQTLTNITSITKAGGPTLTFGGNSINITGGNLDMGKNQITNLKPGTNGTDAVNLDQLNASRINVTSSDHSVTVNPKIDANTHQTTYDLSVNLSNVAKSSWNVKSSAADGGAVAANHNATAKNIADSNTVEFKAGKNLTVEQVNGDNGANVAFALNDNITLGKDGKDGKDGVDGSIGVTGKDGASVVINGKDGSIGLTGPKGADGKDGASVTIKPEKGTTTVAERDGGKEINRVTYTDKDKDGNDIKREIATLDDGLKFTGDDGQTVNRTLGSNLNITGGATDSTTANNIRVTKADDGGLKVNLANNVTLDSNGSLSIGGTTVKDGNITIGNTHITSGVVGNLTHHIENATTVVDGNVLNISDDKKKEAATVRDVLNSGWNLQANGQPVDAVTHGKNVNFASDGSVKITPTTDGNTTTLNLSVNATNVINQVTGNVSANTTTGKAVVGKDGAEDKTDGAANKVATVGDVANTINNTGWITKTTDGANVTVNPGDRVEYVDGKGTKANVTVTNTNGQDVVNVTYDVKTDGTTITVKNGNVTANTGKIIEAKPDGDNAGKVTVTTGDDNKVATVKNVADAINSAGWIVNTGKAKNQDSFKTETGTPTKVGAGDKVNFQAGKNLEVKREGQNIIYATSEDLDAKTITVTTVKVGKDGKDGVDGSIGVTGKDGAAVVINGKDGSIGLTGPKGADGKDGASVTIKPEKGTTTVAERDGGKEINRVTYTDKDKDGNDIKREIATLDDGLKFTGDDGKTVNRTLGSNLNVKGGATTSTTAKNIRVTKAADGQGLDVNLANNIELDNNGSIKIGDTTVNQDGITINNGPSVTKGGIDAGGKTITNVARGEKDTDAVNVSQLKQSVGDVHKRINKVGKEARGGIAGANAAAGLPQVYIPGKSMVAASAGTFKGESAVAVGYSRSSDNGKVIFKLQGNANTQGDVGGSVGVGYQW